MFKGLDWSHAQAAADLHFPIPLITSAVSSFQKQSKAPAVFVSFNADTNGTASALVAATR